MIFVSINSLHLCEGRIQGGRGGAGSVTPTLSRGQSHRTPAPLSEILYQPLSNILLYTMSPLDFLDFFFVVHLMDHQSRWLPHIKVCKHAVIKDRQQEVRAVLEASRYISDCYMPLDIQYIHYIYLNTSL